MNFTTRASNQAAISYAEWKKNEEQQLRKRASQPKRSTSNHTAAGSSLHKQVFLLRSNSRFQLADNDVSADNHAKRTSENFNPHGRNETAGSTASVSSVVGLPNAPKREEPSIFFEQSLIDRTAEKFKFCLVGKFNGSRPRLELIREWAANKWKLRGDWSISLLDHSHVLIRLDNQTDMLHIWTRKRWLINAHLMKVFKWTPTFRPSEREPPFTAVWALFPSLPLVLFDEGLLFPIASLTGKVLAMDGPTRRLTRTNLARVCVEVDLLKELPKRVYIGIGGGQGFWQDIRYENLPSFCTRCCSQGHSLGTCKLNKGASLGEERHPNFFETETREQINEHNSEPVITLNQDKGREAEQCQPELLSDECSMSELKENEHDGRTESWGDLYQLELSLLRAEPNKMSSSGQSMPQKIEDGREVSQQRACQEGKGVLVEEVEEGENNLEKQSFLEEDPKPNYVLSHTMKGEGTQRRRYFAKIPNPFRRKPTVEITNVDTSDIGTPALTRCNNANVIRVTKNWKVD